MENNIDLFNELLDTVYNNLELKQDCNVLIDKPKLKTEPKRTMWTNVYKICSDMNRNEQDILKFISDELNVSFSISSNKEDGVIFADRIKEKDLVSIIRKYFNNFVKCKTCGKSKTEITKKDRTGVSTQNCLVCKAVNYI